MHDDFVTFIVPLKNDTLQNLSPKKIKAYLIRTKQQALKVSRFANNTLYLISTPPTRYILIQKNAKEIIK